MFLDLEFMPWAAEKTQVSLLLFDQIDYLTWKIPLSPSTPTLYLNFVWGGNQNTPPPYLVKILAFVYNPSADRPLRPVGHMIDWLIATGGRGLATPSTQAHKRRPYSPA